MDNADTIIFLHIPKTAGTTLNQIILRHYTPETCFFLGANAQESIAAYRALPEARQRNISLIAGHTAYGLHRYVPGRATYFTFLREPIARVVSFYHYVRQSKQHYLNSAVANQYRTIEAFVSSGITKMVDNGQTRMISGAWLEPPFGAVDAQLYEQAKAHIDQQFALVGLTEQFDAALLLLGDRFGWQDLHYTRQNVGQLAKQNRALTGGERAVVEQVNRWDIALYDHAKNRFAEQTAALGPDFERRLHEFRQANAHYRPQTSALSRARHWAKRFSLRTAARDLLAR